MYSVLVLDTVVYVVRGSGQRDRETEREGERDG